MLQPKFIVATPDHHQIRNCSGAPFFDRKMTLKNYACIFKRSPAKSSPDSVNPDSVPDSGPSSPASAAVHIPTRLHASVWCGILEK